MFTVTSENQSKLPSGKIAGNAIAGALLSVVGVLGAFALMAAFLGYFQAQPLFTAEEQAREGIPSELLEAVEPELVGAWQDRILEHGSRLAGQPAAVWTAEQITAAFEEAGLDTHVIDAPAVVPVTETARFTPAEGAAGSPTVRLEPFSPNYMQPGNTPEGGIEGELVVLTPEVLRERTDFSGVIGLIDAREGQYDSRMAFDWRRYARLGVEALLVSHPDGWEAIDWPTVAERYSGMVSSVPINYVRLAASPEVFQYAGQRVKLEVNTFWREVSAPTVVGIVRAQSPSVRDKAREAVFLSAYYDATGILPGQAPGPAEAMEAGYLIQLAKGLGGLQDRLRRDIVLVAASGQYVGGVGLDEVIRMVRSRPTDASLVGTPARANAEAEAAGHPPHRVAPLLKKREEDAAKLSLVETLLPVAKDPGFLTSGERTQRLVGNLDSEARTFLRDQLEYVLKTESFKLSEKTREAKLSLERMDLINPEDPEFKEYLTRLEVFNEVNSAAGLPPDSLAERASDIVAKYDIPERYRDRLELLQDYHLHRIDQLDRKIALARIFQEYHTVLGIGLMFAPGESEEKLLLASAQATDFALKDKTNLLSKAAGRIENSSVSIVPPQRRSRNQLGGYFGEAVFDWGPDWWAKKGYEGLYVVNMDRPGEMRSRSLPWIRENMTLENSLAETFRTTADFVYHLGLGDGAITTTPLQTWIHQSFGGRVMASGIGQSILPDYPLAGALVGGRPRTRVAAFSMPGFYHSPFLLTDPYGNFEREDVAADYPHWWGYYGNGGHDFIAAGFDDSGIIRQIKDAGESSQRLFKSTGLRAPEALENMTIVTFPARSVAILDLNNPQTMADYQGVRFVSAKGRTEFDQHLEFPGLGIEQIFLPEDRRFFALLQAGAPDNENVRQTRAFLLNTENTPAEQLTREIAGRGYLVADHPILDRIPFRAADGMLHVNGWRLNLQNRFNMADERLNLYHERAENLLATAENPDAPFLERDEEARGSVVYSTLNHPVLRQSIEEAVWGIIWYLFLMVPFIFFFEKLIFCFSDARKQIVAQMGIFLVCFAILRLLHPAFEMVRSSLMILLGFVIILISMGITFLFSSKFKENLEELRKKAGRVTSAEVNKFGVMGSAFMLGLNNMHRRKVRTGLTCATLVLLTFVMISFTSVSSDLADERVALGKAHYQGMLVRNDNFEPLSRDEVFAFQNKYGENYQVARRAMLTGMEVENQPVTPEMQLVRQIASDSDDASSQDLVRREVSAHAYLKFDPSEPLRDRIELWPGSRWFSSQDLGSEIVPILVSEAAASALAIDPADLSEEGVPLTIGGATFSVIGIFESESLESLRDLNGQDLLPYDYERVSDAVADKTGTGTVRLIDENETRVPASDVILLPYGVTSLSPPNSEEIISSVAVAMPGVPYGEASRVIDAFLTQLGEPVYYGLDGVAYRGLQTRKTTMAGLVDLIIPLLIAGLTVLNTMRGSVYERRDEIYVYNAVGIAPRYVFFMFIAEAFVYAVVGSVLGYILSQGVGRVLTEIGLTGGLNMTYTSMATIYASWTLMAAVFISTFFPARQAMKIAAPSEESGWSLPEPKGDRLAFDLPFNFMHRDRFAIISFFARYLRDHGEGGVGRFYAAEPIPLLEPDPDDPGHLIPGISSTTWLKPYDLGVSQELRITMPIDDETGLYKARVELLRLSGTREAWLRLNKGFVLQVRRQFLHWRAVDEPDRQDMFNETRHLLMKNLPKPTEREPLTA